MHTHACDHMVLKLEATVRIRLYEPSTECFSPDYVSREADAGLVFDAGLRCNQEWRIMVEGFVLLAQGLLGPSRGIQFEKSMICSDFQLDFLQDSTCTVISDRGCLQTCCVQHACLSLATIIKFMEAKMGQPCFTYISRLMRLVYAKGGKGFGLSAVHKPALKLVHTVSGARRCKAGFATQHEQDADLSLKYSPAIQFVVLPFWTLLV